MRRCVRHACYAIAIAIAIARILMHVLAVDGHITLCDGGGGVTGMWCMGGVGALCVAVVYHRDVTAGQRGCPRALHMLHACCSDYCRAYSG